MVVVLDRASVIPGPIGANVQVNVPLMNQCELSDTCRSCIGPHIHRQQCALCAVLLPSALICPWMALEVVRFPGADWVALENWKPNLVDMGRSQPCDLQATQCSNLPPGESFQCPAIVPNLDCAHDSHVLSGRCARHQCYWKERDPRSLTRATVLSVDLWDGITASLPPEPERMTKEFSRGARCSSYLGDLKTISSLKVHDLCTAYQ